MAVLQGTLDLIVLRALTTMGPLHAYDIAARLAQMSGRAFALKQGTLYPALVRLEQKGWIKGNWQTTAKGRDAKYYSVTRAGARALEEQTQKWLRFTGLVNKLLLSESE
jgi:transcriptional regulator